MGSERESKLRLIRAALAGEEQDFTRGSIRRGVFLLAIPMVLEMSMESLFAIVDIFFVAKLGAAAIAATGLTEAILTLVYSVSIGLGMAATAIVSRRVGEGDRHAAGIAAVQVVWLGLFLGGLISVAGVLLAQAMLELMGADEETIRVGLGYTMVLLGSSVSIVLLFLIGAVFRGAGNPSRAMRSLWLANGINIVLDPCLIFGLGPFPELGVTGAAIATTIGRTTGVIYQLYYLSRPESGLIITRADIAPNLAGIARIVRVGAGGVFQFLIATSSWLLLIRIIAAYGPAAVAGYTVALRLFDFTFLPAWGFGNAASTLVGQNLGAGKPNRATQAVWQVVRYNVVYMGSFGLVFILAAEPVARFFTQDPAVVEVAAQCMRWVGYGYAVYAVGMVLTQSFNGAGDTTTPMWINFVCYWLVQIPLAYWLANALALGPQGVFISILVGETLLAAYAFLLFRKGRWQQVRV